jgi:hypothetical protein
MQRIAQKRVCVSPNRLGPRDRRRALNRATPFLAGGLLTAALAAGCQSPPPPPPPVVQPSPQEKGERYRELKAHYLAANPGAQVGMIIATRPQDRLAGVRDVPLKEFVAGDVLSIVDDQMTILANATVVKVDPDLLELQYVPAFGAKRAPDVGDIAIRAQQPKPLPPITPR